MSACLHTHHESGHEMTYLIPGPKVELIEEFLREYLKWDPNCAARPDYCYRIHTIFLKSQSWLNRCYEMCEDEKKLDLRLRYYGDAPRKAVYFEIKQHRSGLIAKKRCPIKVNAVPAVLSGQLPERSELGTTDPESIPTMMEFVELMCQYNAKPRDHYHWKREAYLDPDKRCRIMLDREKMHSECGEDPLIPADNARPVHAGSEATLTIKFQDHFPEWCRELVQTFNLV